MIICLIYKLLLYILYSTPATRCSFAQRQCRKYLLLYTCVTTCTWFGVWHELFTQCRFIIVPLLVDPNLDEWQLYYQTWYPLRCSQKPRGRIDVGMASRTCMNSEQGRKSSYYKLSTMQVKGDYAKLFIYIHHPCHQNL